MSHRLYPHNQVRYWLSYSVEDICRLFHAYSLHPQTVRKWIKNGLRTIDNHRPLLVYGNDLITFLKGHNSKNNCSTEFHEMYCMKCQDARPIFRNKVVAQLKDNYLHISGQCRTCKSKMYKSYKQADYTKIKQKFKLASALELDDCKSTTAKTHMPAPERSNGIEPKQGELF